MCVIVVKYMFALVINIVPNKFRNGLTSNPPISSIVGKSQDIGLASFKDLCMERHMVKEGVSFGGDY